MNNISYDKLISKFMHADTVLKYENIIKILLHKYNDNMINFVARADHFFYKKVILSCNEREVGFNTANLHLHRKYLIRVIIKKYCMKNRPVNNNSNSVIIHIFRSYVQNLILIKDFLELYYLLTENILEYNFCNNYILKCLLFMSDMKVNDLRSYYHRYFDKMIKYDNYYIISFLSYKISNDLLRAHFYENCKYKIKRSEYVRKEREYILRDLIKEI